MQDIAKTAFRSYISSAQQHKQLAVMLSLRVLVHAKGHEQITHSYGFSEDTILRSIGLSRLIDKEISHRDGLRELKKRLKEVEQEKPQLLSGPLFENLEWLGQALRLNKTEKAILALLAIAHSHKVLSESLDSTGDLTRVINGVRPRFL